jgi:hypothetical protein
MEKQIENWNNKSEDEQTILCMTHLINKNISLEKEIKNLKKKLLQMTRDCNDEAFKHYKCRKEIKQLKDKIISNKNFYDHQIGRWKREAKSFAGDKRVNELTNINLDLHFMEFRSDKIKYTPSSNKSLPLSHIYIEYKEWYRDNHGTMIGTRTLKELKADLDKHFEVDEHIEPGKYHYKYKGISLIDTDEYLLNNNNDLLVSDSDDEIGNSIFLA